VAMTENNYVRKLISSNNRMINLNIYEREKSEPVIVFVPGMGCHSGLYDPFLSQLSAQGFTVIGIDLTGHGLSEGKRGRFYFEDIIHNISDAASFALENYNQNIGLLGSSFGGICSLYASIFERRFKAVLCHNAIDFRDFYRFSRFPALFYIITYYFLFTMKLFSGIPIPLTLALDWSRVFNDMRLFKLLKKDAHMTWSYTAGSFYSMINTNCNGGFMSIDRPVKIVVGENDRLIPPDYVKTIFERLDPSYRQFEIIPGGGHMLPLEYPSLFTPVVVAWFRKFLL